MTQPVTQPVTQPENLEYIAGYLADPLPLGYWPEAAALIRAAQAVVEAARNSPCRHSADLRGENCPMCMALAAFRKLESGE